MTSVTSSAVCFGVSAPRVVQFLAVCMTCSISQQPVAAQVALYGLRCQNCHSFGHVFPLEVPKRFTVYEVHVHNPFLTSVHIIAEGKNVGKIVTILTASATPRSPTC